MNGPDWETTRKDGPEQLAEPLVCPLWSPISTAKRVRAKTTAEAAILPHKYRSDRSMLQSRTRAALEAPKRSPVVGSSRIAAISYCFGGGTVLETARSGARIRWRCELFTVTLNTQNPYEAKKHQSCKILVDVTGANDPELIPRGTCPCFPGWEMRNAGVDWQMVFLWRGAVHSFTNPASGNDPFRAPLTVWLQQTWVLKQ